MYYVHEQIDRVRLIIQPSALIVLTRALGAALLEEERIKPAA